MQIQTKSRVAITAILDVAANGARGPVPLTDISRRQRVSLSYLEYLFKKLRQNGLVASFRGPGGGYQLNRRLTNISVADVIGAVDGSALDEGANPGAEAGRQFPDCHAANELWCQVNDRLYDYLRSVTLESMVVNSSLSADAAAKPAAPASPAGERGTMMARGRTPAAAMS